MVVEAPDWWCADEPLLVPRYSSEEEEGQAAGWPCCPWDQVDEVMDSGKSAQSSTPSYPAFSKVELHALCQDLCRLIR